MRGSSVALAVGGIVLVGYGIFVVVTQADEEKDPRLSQPVVLRFSMAEFAENGLRECVDVNLALEGVSLEGLEDAEDLLATLKREMAREAAKVWAPGAEIRKACLDHFDEIDWFGTCRYEKVDLSPRLVAVLGDYKDLRVDAGTLELLTHYRHAEPSLKKRCESEPMPGHFTVH